MSQLERRISQARTRIHLNLLAAHSVAGLTVAAGAWSLAWVAQRLMLPAAPALAEQRVLGLPFWWSVAAALALAAIVAASLTAARRVERLAAAVALDRAAGLKERLSTALVCRNLRDPFAQAAVRDAEAAAARIAVPAHVPLRVPRHWPWSVASLLLAAGLAAFMPALDLLARAPRPDAALPETVRAERDTVVQAVNQSIERIRQTAADDPDAALAPRDLKPLELPDSPTLTPDDIRREAVKTLEHVKDQLAARRDADQRDMLNQLQRMLQNLEPQQPGSERDLAGALAGGDFESARQALEEMKRQLEQTPRPGDAEAAARLAEMQKKLDALARKLEQSADQQPIERDLENRAGLSEPQARELLKQLSKMDPDQLRKELQKRLVDKGLSAEQLERLARKIAGNQRAQQAARDLAKKLADASRAMGDNPQSPGDASAAEAQAALDAAADQLSELELAEQQLNDLEAQLAELDDLQEQIAQGQCRGTQSGDGIGPQGPGEGLGEGSRIGKETRPHALKARKVTSRLRAGKIIGQVFVTGPQARGQATAEDRQAVIAATRDATDAITRDEIPRQYSRAVQTYFDRLAGLAGGAPPAERPPDPPKSESQAGTP